MTTKTPLPRPEDVEGYPDNDKAVMVNARGKIRVVERKYYWDKEKGRGLEKRVYLGYVVDGKYYCNASYKKKFDRTGALRSEKSAPEKVKNDRSKAGSPKQPQHRAEAQPSLIRILRAGPVPLFYEVARDTGLIEDLNNAFGETDASLILSMAFNWLISDNHSPYHFKYSKNNILYPFREDISDRMMAIFLQQFAKYPSLVDEFFQARLKRLQEKELIAFDATRIACEPQYYGEQDLLFMEDYEPEKAKVVLLLSRKTNMPVLFRILPHYSDIARQQELLFDFDELKHTGKHISYAFLDNANFSLENLASFIDQKRNIVMPASYEAGSWIEELINEARRTPPGGPGWEREKDCWYKTIPVDKAFDDGKTRRLWVHVCWSKNTKDILSAQLDLQLSLFEDMWPYACTDPGKADADNIDGCYLRENPFMKYYVKDSGIPGREAPRRNEEALAMEKACFGFFALTSTMECSAPEALKGFHEYEPVAETFKSDREEGPDDKTVLPRADTQEGHMLIAFVALSILTQIKNRMQLETAVTRNGKKEILPPLSETYTFREFCSELYAPVIAFCTKGIRCWENISADIHEMTERLGYPGLYNAIPDWI